MPEHYIKFTLPEEQDDLTLAMRGSDLWYVLLKYDQRLRSLYNHHGHEWADDAREKLREVMGEHSIDFDMVE